jgi:hypothetical protein
MAANGKPKPVRLMHDGYNEDIQVNDQTRGMQINPGGKIIVPQ